MGRINKKKKKKREKDRDMQQEEERARKDKNRRSGLKGHKREAKTAGEDWQGEKCLLWKRHEEERGECGCKQLQGRRVNKGEMKTQSGCRS